MYTKLRHYLGTLALSILALASCSKSKVYEQAIPADADFVVRIAVDQLVKKSDILSKENQALREEFFPNPSSQEAKILRPLLEDPAKMGLDFKSPIYCFQSPDLDFGLLARVADTGKLRKLLDQLNETNSSPLKVEEKDGITTFSKENNITLAFSKEAFLFLSAKRNSPKDMRSEAIHLLKLKEGKRYYETEAFKELSGKKSDIALILNYSKVFDLSQYYAGGVIGAETTRALGVDMKTLQVAMHVSFDKGSTTAAFKYLCEDKENLKKFEELTQKTSPKKVSNKYEKYLPKDNYFVASAYINGPEIYRMYQSTPAAAQILEMLNEFAGEASTLFSIIEGEMAFTISSYNPLTNSLNIIGYAEGKSPEAVDALAQSFQNKIGVTDSLNHEAGVVYNKPYSLEREGEHEYKLTMGDIGAPLYFGYRDGTNYLAFGDEAKTKLFTEQKPNISEASYSSLLKGYSASVVVDLGHILTGSPLGGFISGYTNERVYEKLKSLSYLSMTSDGLEGKFELKLTTQDNLLKILTDLWSQEYK